MPFGLLDVLALFLKKKHPAAGAALGAAAGEGATAGVDTTNAQTTLPAGETATTQGISGLEPSNLLAQQARALEAITGETQRLAANPPKPPPAPLMFALSMSKAAPLAGLIQQDYERKRSGNLPILMDRYQAITSALAQSNQAQDLAIRQKELGFRTSQEADVEAAKKQIAPIIASIKARTPAGVAPLPGSEEDIAPLAETEALTNPAEAARLIAEAKMGASAREAQAFETAEKKARIIADQNFAEQAIPLIKLADQSGQPLPLEHLMNLHAVAHLGQGLPEYQQMFANATSIHEQDLANIRSRLDLSRASDEQKARAVATIGTAAQIAAKYDMNVADVFDSFASVVENGGTFTPEQRTLYGTAIGEINKQKQQILQEQDLTRKGNLVENFSKTMVEAKEAGKFGPAIDKALKTRIDTTFKALLTDFSDTYARAYSGPNADLPNEALKKTADKIQELLDEQKKKQSKAESVGAGHYTLSRRKYD